MTKSNSRFATSNKNSNRKDNQSATASVKKINLSEAKSQSDIISKMARSFATVSYNEVGKLDVRQIASQDPLKTLVHHGAHSQTLHQILKAKKAIKQRLRFNNSVDPNKSEESPLHKLISNQTGKKTQLIGQALERHTISNGYHQAYPSFLKSSGPFNVYDHARAKGSSTEQN